MTNPTGARNGADFRGSDQLDRDGGRCPAVTGAGSTGERLDSRTIRDALRVLTDEQRQSVLLAFFGGHASQEISALLGVPRPTVKTRIRDGLIRLRAHLESGGEPAGIAG